MTLHFFVSGSEDGLLLKEFLRRRGLSAGLMSAVKRDQGFSQGGRPIRANERVKAGEDVSVPLPPEPKTSVAPQRMPLQIVYEDEHALVLEKPAGVAVHPTMGIADGTLANAFCGLMEQRNTPMPFRPVNRLDKGTSGLMLCAMNAYAAPLLAQSVKKVYYAAVVGIPRPSCGCWDSPIGLYPGSIIQRCCTPDGKPSRTHYRVLEAEKDGRAALLECRLETGRTHQIRVHASGAGHPLLGDELYGGPAIPARRPALHCGELRFEIPGTRREVCVRSPWPFAWQQLLEPPRSQENG